jgi:hypothetical protein
MKIRLFLRLVYKFVYEEIARKVEQLSGMALGRQLGGGSSSSPMSKIILSH